MECELAQQKIALFAYGELPDDQCHAAGRSSGDLQAAVRKSLQRYRPCNRQWRCAPAQEPSANLLAQARLRLEEALDTMPRSGWLMRAQQSMLRGMSVLGRAPVAASALLVLGLASGGWAGYRIRSAQPTQPRPQLPAAIAGPGTIANVSSIVREPNTENVEVHFNRLVPETTQGSLDDPQIRQLLLVGAQSQVDPGVAAEFREPACRRVPGRTPVFRRPDP